MNPTAKPSRPGPPYNSACETFQHGRARRLPPDDRLIRNRLHQASHSGGLATAIAVVGISLGLVARVTEAKTFLYADLQHFYRFAEVAFTSAHIQYYASVADQTFTYAHLPLFPMLLAPFYRLGTLAGIEPIFVVKGLVHAFEIATVGLIVLYASRQAIPIVGATLVGLSWLGAPWVFEGGALNAHVTAVAAFFLVAAVIRRDVPWQAGVFMALATPTRSEFIIPTLAMAGWHMRCSVRAGLFYGAGATVVGGIVVGPYLLYDAAALHWGVLGHLQGRGDGLPVLRGFLEVFIGRFPQIFEGSQDWAMPLATVLAPFIGWASRDHSLGLLRATLLYAAALTLGHGRYYVLPLTAGLLAAATPTRWPWIPAVFVVEFFLPIARNERWILRAVAIAAAFLWPLRRWARSTRTPPPESLE